MLLYLLFVIADLQLLYLDLVYMDCLWDHGLFVDHIYFAITTNMIEKLLLVSNLVRVLAVIDNLKKFRLNFQQLFGLIKLRDNLLGRAVAFQVNILFEFGNKLQHILTINWKIEYFFARTKKGAVFVFQKIRNPFIIFLSI